MANFALPAHYRTWQFQVNTAIAAQGTVALTNARCIRLAKDAMLGTGAWTDSSNGAVASSGNWSVVSSCDGSGGAGSFGNNDSVDRWAADANLNWAATGSNHSWAVIRQTGIAGGSYYLYLDLNQAGATYRLNWGWSNTLYTNGTATAAPTGANLFYPGAYPLAASQNWGGAAANGAQVLHVMKSADGKATRILFCRAGFATGLWNFDELENAPAGWTSPAVAGIFGDSIAPAASILVQNLLANAGNYVAQANVNGNPALALYNLLYFGGSSLVTVPIVANDMAAAWPMYRVGAYVRTGQGLSTTVPIVRARGNLGAIRDLWWMQAQLAEGDGIPAAGTRNFTVLGDTCHPWNTTAITLA